MLFFQRFTCKTLRSPFICTTSRFLATGRHSPIPDVPTSAYYDELINGAGRQRDFASVGQLLNKRHRDGCFNTNDTFKFVSTDLSILDDLLRTINRLTNGFPRKNAYDTLISRLCKLQRADDALRVADAMIRGGHGANVCTFHPILNFLTRKRKMDEAWRLIISMRENQIMPDITSYNYILTSYCFVGDLESAAGVLTKMADNGMEADTRTYDALVLGVCKAGKMEASLAVLRRMIDVGVPASYSTYAHVIGGLLKCGYYTQAVEFVLCFAGRDKELDTENFGVLASRLIALKKFNEAKLVLEEMRNRRLSMGHKLKEFCELHVTS